VVGWLGQGSLRYPAANMTEAAAPPPSWLLAGWLLVGWLAAKASTDWLLHSQPAEQRLLLLGLETVTKSRESTPDRFTLPSTNEQAQSTKRQSTKRLTKDQVKGSRIRFKDPVSG